jgi:hypothetical protein
LLSRGQRGKEREANEGQSKRPRSFQPSRKRTFELRRLAFTNLFRHPIPTSVRRILWPLESRPET